MDHITSKLDTLAELDADGISALEASIRSEFKTLDDSADTTPETVDAMLALADALETVQGEQARRAAEAEELAARRAEASARVNGTGEEPEEEVVEVEEEVVPENTEDEDPETIEASASPEVEEAAEFSVESDNVDAGLTTSEAQSPAHTERAEIEKTGTVEVDEEEVIEAPEAKEIDVPEGEVISEPSTADTEASVEEVEVEATTEAAVETPVEAEASNSEEIAIAPEAQEEAQTVTAAAEESFEAPADRQPVLQDSVAPVAITAGADIPGITAGTPLKSMDDVASAMEKRIFSLRHAQGGNGEQLVVASVEAPYTEANTFDKDAESNWKKVLKAKESGALVAAGGWAAPVETRYDIFGLGDNWRPVKASLPKFRADRGGIAFVVPPQLSSYADAVGVWTNQNDIDASTEATPRKAVLRVNGANMQTAYLDAVTLQLEIGNLISRAWPELVARHNELALIQHAREAEINLLDKINAGSTQVTAGTELGVARDFLVQVRQAATAYRSRHRINPRTNLQVILPTWVVDAMAADLTKQMPGDDKIDTGIAEIEGWLRNIGITMTATPDLGFFGAQSAGALSAWPSTFKWFLFSEGTFLFLDGGTLDLGIIRDSGLVSKNDYRMFVETFEGLAKIGIESLAVTSTFKVSGEAAALTETNAANNPVVDAG